MRGLLRDALDGEAKNLFDLGLGELLGLPGARPVPQPVESGGPGTAAATCRSERVDVPVASDTASTVWP